MHIIYLDKKITLDSIVSDINLINIDENINYLKRLDGILIKGYLDLSCQYISLGIIKEFKDKIEINKLVAYENIYSNNIVSLFLVVAHIVGSITLLPTVINGSLGA